MPFRQIREFGGCHLAFWLPLIFASPMLVGVHNIDDLGLPAFNLIIILLALSFGLAILTTIAASLCGPKYNRIISLSLLGCSLVLVAQGNIVHELFYYGEFNGEEVDWRSYGWLFWAELILFSTAFPVCIYLLIKSNKVQKIVWLMPIILSISLVLPGILDLDFPTQFFGDDDDIDPAVFEFSTKHNFIHLIPDGLQSDIVKEVLEENPQLKAKFQGFTFFDNHLGKFQNTAPSIPTIYSGEVYDLSKGFTWLQVKNQLKRAAYQNVLHDHGYRLDFVSIVEPYCAPNAASCVVRGFNDLKARGYFEYVSAGYTLRLIADLALFRHLPMYFKEKLYDNGNWFLSTENQKGASPFPDPVIREWAKNMVITDEQKKYKAYHYIGTHEPPRWGKDCNYTPEIKRSRAHYAAQTYCLLDSLATFLDILRERKIYDQTAIVITADHGNHSPAYDLQGQPKNKILNRKFIGHARPTFMVKEMNNRNSLTYSNKATSMIDIAPTSLDLVELSANYQGESSLKSNPRTESRDRSFHLYNHKQLWSGDPVAYSKYIVTGDVKKFSSWSEDENFNIKLIKDHIKSDFLCNRKIHFGSGQNDSDTKDSSSAYYSQYLSKTEPGGRWSELPVANIFFRPGVRSCDKGELLMKVSAFVTEQHQLQKTTAFLNNKEIGVFTIKYGDNIPQDVIFKIPGRSLKQGEVNVLKFVFQNSTSPLSLGISGDKRQLGIFFISLTLQ